MLQTASRSCSLSSAWGSGPVCLLRYCSRTCCRSSGSLQFATSFCGFTGTGPPTPSFACLVAEIGPHKISRPHRSQLLSSPRLQRSLRILSRSASSQLGYCNAPTLHPECCPIRLPQVDLVLWCSADPMPKRPRSPGRSPDSGAMVPNASDIGRSLTAANCVLPPLQVQTTR